MSPKQKRFLVYSVAAFLPLLAFYITVSIFLDPNLGMVAALAIGMAAIFLLHKVVMNPLSRMEEDGLPMLFTLESRGAIVASNIIVHSIEPIVEGKVGGQHFTAAYSRQTIFDMIFHNLPVHEWNDKTHIHLAIPKTEFYDSQFKLESARVMFYNRNLHLLLTKDLFRKMEEGKLLENLLVALKRETTRLSDTTEAYTQSAIKMFFKQFDLQKYGIIIIVALVVIGGYLAWPAISQWLGMATEAARGPLTIAAEAAQPIG